MIGAITKKRSVLGKCIFHKLTSVAKLQKLSQWWCWITVSAAQRHMC